MEFINWLIDAFRRAWAWLVRNPPPLPPEEPQEPPVEPVEPDPPDEPQEPVPEPDPVDPPDEPQPEPEPVPDPLQPLVLHPDEWATSGAWAVKAGYVEAAQVGDGELTDTTSITLPTGSYYLVARVNAPNAQGDRFYAGVDGVLYRSFPTTWNEWVVVTVGAYPTIGGEARVGIGPGETGLRIDALALIPTNYTGSVAELLGEPPQIVTPGPEPEPPVVEPEPAPVPGPTIPPASVPTDTSLRVNPAFNPADPRTKAGKRFTAEMREAYDGIINHWIRGTGKAATVDRLNRGDSYNVGRSAAKESISLSLLQRFVGDPRLLDGLAQLALEAERGLRTTWAPGYDPSVITRAPHGKAFFPWLYDKSKTDLYGQDDHLSDSPKAWANLAGIAWALHVNRGTPSPHGFDYGAIADAWAARLRDLEAVWSGDGAGFPAAAKVAGTYKGYRAHPSGSSKRKGKDEWPIWMRAGSHTNWSIARLTYYMGRLLGKSEAQYMSGIREHVTEFMQHDQGSHPSPYGPALLFGRQNHRWFNDPTDYEIPTTYAEMFIPDGLDLYYEGALGGLVTLDYFQRFARSVAAFVLVGEPNAFTVKAGLAGLKSPRFTTPAGVTRQIGTACESPSSTCADRTMSQYAGYAYHLLLPWDTSDDKLERYGRASWLAYAGTSERSLARPKSLMFPVGLFLKGALA